MSQGVGLASCLPKTAWPPTFSVGAHNHGKVVDVNNALDGDGPFSPERAGSVPIGDLIKMCFSGKYSEAEVYGKVVGKGGFVGYLNTNDARVVIDKMQEGDKECESIYKAFVYQISKAIGEMSVVLEGKVDQIIFTGGIAYSPILVPDLKSKGSSKEIWKRKRTRI